MPKKETAKRPKGKKIGRANKKIAGRGSYLSLYVRNKISGADYFRLTGQKAKF